VEQIIALARHHELPCVELRGVGGTIHLPAYFAARYGDFQQLARLVNATLTRIVSLGTCLRLFDNTAESRAAFLTYVPWAQACGATSLRVFDGGTHCSAEEMACAHATLRWWRELRDANGWQVDIVIETHDTLAIEENLLRFLDAYPETRLLWDAHHTWRKGGADPVRTWQLIRDHAHHIHVKDSVTDPREPTGFAYVLPGDGEFPMAALVDALRADAYDGILSLEWERHWHPGLPPLDAALHAARERAWW
jgi:sugar phosphate isomerase/epimerase